MILKSKITRVIAFLLSCGIVGVCTAQCVRYYEEAGGFRSYRRYTEEFNTIGWETGDIYRDLWVISTMYLRNLDENGNFTGSEELKEQTFQFLRSDGLMDEDGNLTIDVPDGYTYYAGWKKRTENGKSYISSVGTAEDMQAIESENEYVMTRQDDIIDYSYIMHFPYSVNSFNWFETDYGMTYYYIDGKGVALFDFDTSGLNSYTDELGATIYFKLDGTTPLPERHYIRYNGDDIDLDYDNAIYNRYDSEIYDDPDYDPDYDQDYGQDYDYEKYGNDYDPVRQGISESDRQATQNHPTIAEPPSAEEVPDDRMSVTAPSTENATEPSSETATASAETAPAVTDPAVTEAVTSPFLGIPDDSEAPNKFFSQYLNDGSTGYYYYDRDQDALIPVKAEAFGKTQGEEMDLMIAVCPPQSLIADIKADMQENSELINESVRNILNLTPFGIAALILAVYVLIFSGYSTKEKKYVLEGADKIFAEIPVFLIGCAVLASVCLLNYDVHTGLYDFLDLYYDTKYIAPVMGVIVALIFAIVVLMLNTLLVRLKCKSFWKTTFIGALVMWMIKLSRKQRERHFLTVRDREMMRNDKATRNFIMRTILFIVVEIFAAICSMGFYSLFPIIMSTFILSIGNIIVTLLDFRDITRLYSHISDMNSGNYEKKKVSRESVAYVPTEKLNNISDGIQAAVEKQVKSERMKIDLVTNVSHDLKTPLTSIISYIDLLSAEELSPAARDYVTIIDNKSQRLKAMVADLFDLAKATSRTDINTEELDAVILTEQVLADLSDKIETSGREIRKDIQADSAPVIAEGKKLYRVFQNLIDNALKYSLEGTRIYVTLKNELGSCKITVKNIASYEMNFSPEEIMERFTRGDESRSTDGNGLGLSIAKSFTEACGGRFGVSIDGDVFIAELTLPLIVADPNQPTNMAQ